MNRIFARGAVLFFSLSAMACAPAMMVPTAVPMGAGKSAEIGLGGMLGKSNTDTIQLADEETNMFGSGATGVDTHYNYQAWARFNFDEDDRSSSEMGMMGQIGAFSLLSGGVYWRKPVFVSTETMDVGLQVEVGAVWAGIATPLAFQVVENLWITSMPTLRYSLYSALHIPVGLSYEVTDFFRIDVSTGIHTHVVPNYNLEDYMYYGAGAIAFQF